METIQKRKKEILNEMVKRLMADERLSHLAKAKALLDGGRWWPKAKAYAARVDAAYMDYAVDVEAFREIVEGYRAGILKGCERCADSLERRSKSKGKSRAKVRTRKAA